RHPAFLGRDQVERSQFIVLPPAPPVRQLRLPGFELSLAHQRTGRRSLGGRLTDKGRGYAKETNKDRDCPRECQRAHDASSPLSMHFAMTLQDGSFGSNSAILLNAPHDRSSLASGLNGLLCDVAEGAATGRE